MKRKETNELKVSRTIKYEMTELKWENGKRREDDELCWHTNKKLGHN